MQKTTLRLLGVAIIALLAIPAAASAHVTLQPEEVPAESFPRMDVRVPNEIADAATDKVEVELPDGFIFAFYETVPGWETEIEMEKLDEPVEAFGESYDEQVKTVTWTATDDAATIGANQFQDFGLEVGVPSGAQPGDVLTFPAIQTYDNGEVVRWIGDPESDEPAPTVIVTEPAGDHGGGTDPAAAASETESATVTVDDEDGGAPTWLAILGVVLGVAGIGVGGAALRRRSS